MRIIFLGPPGSGKGTQASLIAQKYNIANISTGIILQQELYKYSKLHTTFHNMTNIINSGDLVNDEFVIKLIIMRINQDDCRNGFILDGFPRTIIQALSIDKYLISMNFVIQFMLPDSVIINRIMGRRIHLSSGRTYHIKFNPPKHHNLDDITGETLTIRKDDRENTIRTRLNKYYQYTNPIINYYKREARKKNIRYLSIDGNRKICEIYEELINILRK